MGMDNENKIGVVSKQFP